MKRQKVKVCERETGLAKQILSCFLQ